MSAAKKIALCSLSLKHIDQGPINIKSIYDIDSSEIINLKKKCIDSTMYVQILTPQTINWIFNKYSAVQSKSNITSSFSASLSLMRVVCNILAKNCG